MIFAVVIGAGLVVGSFLNAWIYRTEVKDGLRPALPGKSLSVFKGRSYCPLCAHELAWCDLIPLVSFLLLLGKCRYCHGRISIQYPLVEISTAVIFLLMFNEDSMGVIGVWSFLYLWIVASLLIAIFVYDLKHYLIPDKFLFLAIGAVILWRFFEVLSFGYWDFIGHWSLVIGHFFLLINPLASALGAGVFFFLIHALSRGRAMGFGDVKLSLFMGLFLGWPNILVALLLAFFMGAMVSAPLLLLKKKGWKSEVPFGPFLIAGILFAFLWGDKIVSWYLSLLAV